MNTLDHLVAQPGTGLTSVCSAHPVVLAETLRHGAERDTTVLIEATCNQVNQQGGYTGLRPADFRRQVADLARAAGLADDRLLLGGDHLGPNPWKHLAADKAMGEAETLVTEFVRAGFTKIHLDTSMRCADDPPGALAPEVSAERAARLAVCAEQAAGAEDAEDNELRYVIGTEVPVPGGESAGAHGIEVSTAEAVAHTVDVTRAAFEQAGVGGAWPRVRAVVAQPGVEFSDVELHPYRPGQAAHLAGVLPPEAVFEAHSTDYQTGAALAGLVADRFAVLKVGPGLTFAYREAVYALALIEDELCGAGASGVRRVLEKAMLAEPRWWQGFYPEDDPERAAYARAWSRSDRSRYYWPVPSVREAIDRMMDNLTHRGIPAELASQHLSWLIADEVPGVDVSAVPEQVLAAAVRRVLDVYAEATG